MSATTTQKIQETRFYNGVILGHDEGAIYKVNFVTVTMPWQKENHNYLEIEGNNGRWVESNVTWIAKWYPQILLDIANDKVDGWKLQ